MTAEPSILSNAKPEPLDGWRWLAIAAIVVLAMDIAFLASGAAQNAWLIGPEGRLLCRDFSIFWTSAQLIGAGQPAAAYDLPTTMAAFHQAGGAAACAMPMHYPPTLLLWVSPLAGLSYPVAAALWIAFGLAAYACSLVLTGAPKPAMLAGLAAPAVVACVAVGQGALLLAALATAGLALLDRRPLLAGALIGLMAFKPQFGVLVPLALAVSGRWRAFGAAAATVVATTLIAGLAFGWEIYPAFLQSLAAAQDAVLEQGRVSWAKLQSTYGLARAFGVDASIAWGLQGAVSLLAAGGVALLWRSRAPLERKAAGLLVAMLAASPYVMIYDLTLLAAGAVWLLADRDVKIGWLSAAAIGAGLLLPIAHGQSPWPIGPFALICLAAVVACRQTEIWKTENRRGLSQQPRPVRPLLVKPRGRTIHDSSQG